MFKMRTNLTTARNHNRPTRFYNSWNHYHYRNCTIKSLVWKLMVY